MKRIEMRMSGDLYIGQSEAEIVEAMRKRSLFTHAEDLGGYLAGCQNCLRELYGVRIWLQGEDDQDRAASYLSGIVRAGMARWQ